MLRNRIALFIIATAIVACATVRQEDLDAWVDQPIAALETHPIFVTIPVVKTMASDGTEIWNYVNGANLGQCSGGGTIWGKQLNNTSYSQFASCVQRFAACNNIFYIRDGKVQRYTPVGTGGASCFTTAQLQPQFRGSTNIR